MKLRKVGVIGLGHVGAHVAYSLALQGICDELVLIDKDEKKVKAERQDLQDSATYLPHRIRVKVGNFDDLGDCDVVVNSIGKISLLTTGTRLSEMDFTIEQVDSYIDKVGNSGFDGVFVNITNPCDIVTEFIDGRLNLPKGRVLGTGTGLDTSRLKAVLARQTGLDEKSITAYMLGEHGASQFAAWSCVNFNGKPLSEWAKVDERFRFDGEALHQESIDNAWVTYAGKACTEYGIAATAARMVSIVLHDEKTIMGASCKLEGEYGESNVFAGVPAVLGASGVEEVIELPLTEEELNRFHICCDDIRSNRERVKVILK